MNTIIIEDEEFAARRLENMITECDSNIKVLAQLQSVKESVEWLRSNPQPDLIFLDIQLDDDLSFAIFEQVEVKSNIIFTTAFDEYAIKAFKLKSIDYLLKPIGKEELNAAITKYKNWTNNSLVIDPSLLRDLIAPKTVQYRDRFMVSVGEKLKTVQVDEIAYFFSTGGITFMVTHANRQYSIDISLDNLIPQLNPRHFFRVNRQYLVSLKGIGNVHVFPKSRLKLDLNPAANAEIFVSIEKVVDFKEWLDGGNG